MGYILGYSHLVKCKQQFRGRYGRPQEREQCCGFAHLRGALGAFAF